MTATLDPTTLSLPAMHTGPTMRLHVAQTAPAVASAAPQQRSDGSQMLDEVCDWYDRLMVLPSKAARDMAALWVLASHVRDNERQLVWDMSPRLVFTSDQPASGKTLATKIATNLAFNGIKTEDPSGPGLLQMISERKATVGVDEFDLIIQGGNGGGTMLRSILNGGAYAEGAITRAGHPEVSSFTAMVLCGLGATYRTHHKLEALRTRSLHVELRQARADEYKNLEEYDRQVHRPLMLMTRSSMEGWGSRYAKALGKARPSLPAGVNAREREKWTSLLAVADMCGDDWPARARAACRAFSLGDQAEDKPRRTARQQLLLDLQAAFDGDERLSTGVVLERLSKAGWPFSTTDSEAARASASALSRQLRSVSLSDGSVLGPRKARIDGRPLQCYLLEDVEEAVATYVPTVPTDDGRSDQSSGVPTEVAFEDMAPEDCPLF